VFPKRAQKQHKILCGRVSQARKFINLIFASFPFRAFRVRSERGESGASTAFAGAEKEEIINKLVISTFGWEVKKKHSVLTMDTIYSNKKYLQSLNAADYYRAGTTLRPSVSISTNLFHLSRANEFHFYFTGANM
jgi:hypothetical protein